MLWCWFSILYMLKPVAVRALSTPCVPYGIIVFLPYFFLSRKERWQLASRCNATTLPLSTSPREDNIQRHWGSNHVDCSAFFFWYLLLECCDLQRGGFGRVFCCKKKRKGKKIVPRCYSERILTLTWKQDLPECAFVLAVLSELQNFALCWRLFLALCATVIRAPAPFLGGPVSLNACNVRPALAFLVINKRVPCYLEVSVLSAITSALNEKTTPTGRFSANGEQRALICSYVVRFPFLPSLFFLLTTLLERGLCIFE